MGKTVVYCGTRNHYPRMVVAAKSLLSHTRADRVWFLTEDDAFPEPLPDVVRVMNVSGQQWFLGGANVESAWTYMAFIRLALGKLMPEEGSVLYLDTDTLVMRDISPLWQTDLDGKLFGMVREDVGDTPLEMMKAFSECGKRLEVFQSDNPRPAYCVRPYYNSGVMLMNLSELIRTNMDDRLIREIQTVKYPYPDQDAINLLCAGKIAELPQEYNVIRALAPDFPEEQVRIRHFCSDKPLWKSGLWQSYKRKSWEEVMCLQKQLNT